MSWLDMYDEPYCSNPIVVVVLVDPSIHKYQSREANDDSFVAGLLRTPKTLLGLHVVKPPLATYPETAEFFQQHNVSMVDPVYIGPMETIPHGVLNADMEPLIFLAHQMNHMPLKLRSITRQKVKSHGEASN